MLKKKVVFWEKLLVTGPFVTFILPFPVVTYIVNTFSPSPTSKVCTKSNNLIQQIE